VTKTPVVVTWQIVSNGKFVVVARVCFHHGLVAFATTTAVDKLAIGTDTGVLALVFVALTTAAVTITKRVAAPFALAVAFALTAFALLAHAITVALECIALVTAHQIFHAKKTTVRVVELTKIVQENAISHDVKSVPNRQQVENQEH
jgi:predicted membrane protein